MSAEMQPLYLIAGTDGAKIDTTRSRLFDVCRDPGETHDRAPDAPDRIARYRDRVVAWAAAQKARIERRE